MKSAEMAGGEELAWAAILLTVEAARYMYTRSIRARASYDNVDIRFRCVINHTFVHSFGSIN